MKVKALDLFSGCGGLSLGLKAAGIDVLWANELDPNASATYRSIHSETQLFEGDANTFLRTIKKSGADLPAPGDVDLLAGGPPCQGFSGYNRHRRPDDPRNSLLETFLGFVDFLKPPHVLIENVPGMLSMGDGTVVRSLLETLKGFGYSTRLGVLQAGHYGLPQNRWRVFVWGASSQDVLPDFPFPTHEFPRTTVFGATKFRDAVMKAPKVSENMFWKLDPKVTVWDAIGDLPEIVNGARQEIIPYGLAASSAYQKRLRGNASLVYDHVTNMLGDVQLERCKAVPKRPGSGWLDLPERLKPANLVRHGDKRYNNRFGRLDWAGTFNTILTKNEPYWSAVFHPDQDRLISVREAARAQSITDETRFHGSLLSKYRQVGNAVPVKLAYSLAQSIKDILN